jgi:hypothetical protein
MGKEQKHLLMGIRTRVNLKTVYEVGKEQKHLLMGIRTLVNLKTVYEVGKEQKTLLMVFLLVVYLKMANLLKEIIWTKTGIRFHQLKMV